MLAEKESASEYSHLVLSEFPYVFLRAQIIYLKSRKDFNTADLGKMKGVAYLNVFYFKNIAKSKSLSLLEIPQVANAVQMVLQKRADYMLEADVAITSILQTLTPQESQQLTVVDANIPPLPVYFMVHSKHRKLLKKIDERLKDSLRGDLSKYPEIRGNLNITLEN